MDKLGIDAKLLLSQVVNFSIVLFLLSRFLYKPILKNLKERQKKITEGLAWSEKAQVEEEKLKRRGDELLREARDEAKVILENAKKDGKRLKAELVEDGKKEIASQKAKLEKETAAQMEELTQKLTARTVDIAAAMVKQVLPKLLSEKEQHELLMSQLKKVAHERK